MKHTRLKFLIAAMQRVARPIPLTAQPGQLSCQPFFIISSGRSGSTLLRAIIQAHSDVSIPPESHVLGRIVVNFVDRYRFFSWDDLVRLTVAHFSTTPGYHFWDLAPRAIAKAAIQIPESEHSLARLIDCVFQVYRQEHEPEAHRWGDKSMSDILFLPQLHLLYPQGRFIHIVRDGRDVVTSYVENRVSPNLEDACAYWLKTVQKGIAFGKQVPADQFLEVHYEDLARDPEPVIRHVCDFLALDFQAAMLQPEQMQDELKDANRPLHQNLARPINERAVGKWQRKLSPAQQAAVSKNLAPVLQQLGYLN